MALFESKFLRLTRDVKSATDLAALFYLAVTGGFQALARPNSSTRMSDYIRSVIADHLIRRQAVAVPAQA